jgi:hypothetical protein
MFSSRLCSQHNITDKDSVVYHFIYRDTVIYKTDTVKVRLYVYADTLQTEPDTQTPSSEKRNRRINTSNWGIGPSAGAYYSPFNGFDVNFGFGIQYYFISIPSFRNPHMKNRGSRSHIHHP